MKKKVVLSVYGSPQYVYYRKTKQERSWNYYLAGRANIVLNRFFITVGGGGSDARQRWNTEVDIRPRRKAWNAEASILWQATKKTSFFAAFSRQNYDFESLTYELSNLRDRLNRTEDRSSFTGFYQLSYRVRSFVSLQYSRFNFPRSTTFKDSRSLGLFGGFEFSPFGIVRGRVNLGYKAFDSLTSGKRLFSGLVGDTGVSIRLLRFLDVRGSYKRDVEFSVFYDNAFFTENIYGGGLSLYIHKNIRLDYDYRLGRNRYPEAAAGAPGDVKRNDDYRIHSLGLYFQGEEEHRLGRRRQPLEQGLQSCLGNGRAEFRRAQPDLRFLGSPEDMRMKRNMLLLIMAVLALGAFAQEEQDVFVKEYKIGPKDLLEITVFELPELNQTVRVSEDGSVSLPLLDQVVVGGMTKDAVEKKLASLLEEKYCQERPGLGIHQGIPEPAGWP